LPTNLPSNLVTNGVSLDVLLDQVSKGTIWVTKGPIPPVLHLLVFWPIYLVMWDALVQATR